MRKILAITGIRAEYDIQSMVYRAIEAHPDLELSLVVTGAHFSSRFGETVKVIREDGFHIAEHIDSLIDSNRDVGRVKGMAVELLGLAQTVDRLRPDLLLVLGDREEAISTALVGAYMNIPVAHLCGGDRVVGNVDDHVRHAVTKLAHLHFTTNEDSAERVRRMGEELFRVFNVGHPGLDRLASETPMTRESVMAYHGFSRDTVDKPLLVLIQHPISSDIEGSYNNMKATLDAVRELKLNTVISYPNSDPGSDDIIRCIDESRNVPFVKAYRHIPRKEFINTLRQAACLVGNSSAGILEAPFLKLPVVNVGQRQMKRLHADNVEFVPHERTAIVKAVHKACFDAGYREKVKQCKSPYGDGKSAAAIAEALAKIEITQALLQKDVTY